MVRNGRFTKFGLIFETESFYSTLQTVIIWRKESRHRRNFSPASRLKLILQILLHFPLDGIFFVVNKVIAPKMRSKEQI